MLEHKMEIIIKIQTCWHSLSISAITHKLGLLYMHTINRWKEENNAQNSFHITRAQFRSLHITNWPSSGQMFHALCMHSSCLLHALFTLFEWGFIHPSWSPFVRHYNQVQGISFTHFWIHHSLSWSWASQTSFTLPSALH